MMLHIKLKGMKQHGGKYFAHRHTLDPRDEVQMPFFSESSPIAYQINRNGA